jgi:predicted alpha-1,2-mannosidase
MVLLLRLFCPLSLLVFSTGLLAQQADTDFQPADLVNPLIGTAKSTQPTVWESNGATFPGVLAPFGMVQITPDGYRYADTHISGFSYLDHTSGWGSRGSFLILPYTGPVAQPSSFSHKRESSHPWQYDVDLLDYHIHAAFAATTHASLARFTFPASTQGHIVLSGVSNVTLVSDTVLTGQCRGTWFIAHFSRPFQTQTPTTKGSEAQSRPAHAETGLRLDFTTTADETIEVRTGFSRTSQTAATANLQSEMPTADFNRISREGRAVWNRLLSRVTIKGGDAAQRTVFYTALYHSSFAPAILSDAAETPRRYAPLYPWDTYRSEHPLITLLDPDAEGEMIASTLAEYDRTGWLPTGNMLGNHNVELILDSYTKGVRNFDIAKAGQAIRKSLTEPPYARRDMALYNSLGYVPASRVNSVSQTLEFAYNDWAAATFLRAIGEPAGTDTLLARSFNYQHVYDPETGFMRAKTADSATWTDGGFCEGTPWTYSWYVPHDVRGLINLMGGSATFLAKLTTCFKEGHYVHDNEPPLHYAYLFDFAGEPWKTQQWARQITETSYSNAPGGLPGNDDLGALSSWYVFSAMGFYPVTPGRPLYELGSPVFNTCILHLPNGKDFTILAPGSSASNRYIQSATLNGHPYQHPWITHEAILSGGTLALAMGPVPNKHWGAAPEDAPPSQTTGQPDFHIGTPSLTTATATATASTTAMAAASATASRPSTPAGAPVYWSAQISNTGTAAGSAQVALFIDGQPYTTKSILLNAGDSTRVSIPVILYRAGPHSITVGKTGFPQRLTVQARPAALLFTDLTIPLPPVLLRTDSFTISARVENTGSSIADTSILLYIDHRPSQKKRIVIQPGQQKEVRFKLAGANCAPLTTITIGGLPPLTIRILDPKQPPAPDTSLLQQLGAIFYTTIVHGTPKWLPGLFGEAVQLDASRGNYIELTPTKALDSLAHSDSMTMMAWIYPTEEENFSDIFCRGDWATLQLKASNTMVNFYTGGWEGHEAVSPVPANWNRHWHHIAGVTRAPYEELYIDGRLVATKHMEPRDPNGETGLADYSNHPWSIGRNVSDPTRLFKGYIGEPMLFRKALTQEEINRVMMHL